MAGPGNHSLQTSVTGPGRLTFNCAADGPYEYYLMVDGVQQVSIAMATALLYFTPYTTYIPSGTHTLTWYSSCDAF